MLLPSDLKSEIEQLKILIRDLSIETSTALQRIQNDLNRKIQTVEGTVDTLKDAVSDVSMQAVYLEDRISGIRKNVEMTSDKIDEFNVYSFMDPQDAGIEIEEEELVPISEIEEVTIVESGFTAPLPKKDSEPEQNDIQPDGSESASQSSEDEQEPSSYWWDGMAEEVIACELVGMIDTYIDAHGPIMNNQVIAKVYPKALEITPKIKREVKKVLGDNDDINEHVIDKFRRLYHKGGDGDEEYERYLSEKTLRDRTITVKLHQANEKWPPLTVEARVDTGADRSSIDEMLAEALGWDIDGEKTIKSVNGRKVREYGRGLVTIEGIKFHMITTYADRSKMSHPVLIGHDVIADLNNNF